MGLGKLVGIITIRGIERHSLIVDKQSVTIMESEVEIVV